MQALWEVFLLEEEEGTQGKLEEITHAPKAEVSESTEIKDTEATQQKGDMPQQQPLEQAPPEMPSELPSVPEIEGVQEVTEPHQDDEIVETKVNSDEHQLGEEEQAEESNEVEGIDTHNQEAENINDTKEALSQVQEESGKKSPEKLKETIDEAVPDDPATDGEPQKTAEAADSGISSVPDVQETTSEIPKKFSVKPKMKAVVNLSIEIDGEEVELIVNQGEDIDATVTSFCKEHVPEAAKECFEHLKAMVDSEL
uniref:Uncharacterized protein n=1 Tax=Fibrocapsa japonica TaxID=94617 RepID=A0A7S2UWG7_9STRA